MRLHVDSLELRDVPASFADGFDATRLYTAPAGWQEWASNNSHYYGVYATGPLTGTQQLSVFGNVGVESRLWNTTPVGSDVKVSLAVRSNTPAPIQLIARGDNLGSTSATYVAASVSTGGVLNLRTATQTLATLTPTTLVPNAWLRASVQVSGSNASVKLQRLDTNQWLAANGSWQAAETTAIVGIVPLTGGVLSGIGRSGGTYGAAVVDDFRAETIAAPPRPTVPPTVPPIVPPTVPPVVAPEAPTTDPRKFDHIRIAQLAYSGQRITDVETNHLQTNVDLVVANPSFLNTFEAASAETPKTIYSNVTNIYEEMLSDWLGTSGNKREEIFYHAAAATPFQGSSSASTPVTWFWNAWKTSGTTATDVAAAVRTTGTSLAAGQSIVVGMLDKFREINVTAPSGTHSGVWEYASTSGWRTLATLSNGTNAMRASGRISFDPPSDWAATQVGNSESLFHVRYRVISGTLNTGKLLGRDYVNANGGTTGVIPAFDSNADRNNDGYLTDSEYAARRAGFDARFVSESRLFWPYYGQMRFVVNPASDFVQDWSADYHADQLAETPNADGYFLDNTNGKLPFSTPVKESTTNYTADSTALVAAVKAAIGNHSIIVNTSGAFTGDFADGVTAAGGIAFEEFLLRPTTANWSTVNDVANVVNDRLSVSPTSEVILDSHPGTASMLDARTRMGVLSYYYLLADPDRTYLMVYGGYSPASGWQNRWIPAAATDVGEPTGERTVFASGNDPANTQLQYKVYSRSYENALVVYKPLSYTLGRGTGTTADATATTHMLGGNYRVLNADGTLGPVVNRITLRNGDGAVLMKA